MTVQTAAATTRRRQPELLADPVSPRGRKGDVERSARRCVAGRFIVFEGIDGSGKSTALAAVSDALAADGVRHWTTREETDTDLGAMVRRSITEGWPPLTTTFLFLADRARHAREIQAHLDADELVLCDRYAPSTYAYQSVTLSDVVGDPAALLDALHAPISLKADHILLFQVDPKVAVGRTLERGSTTPYEKQGFLSAVEAQYDAMAAADDRFILIDGSQPPDEVAAAALGAVRDCLQS